MRIRPKHWPYLLGATLSKINGVEYFGGKNMSIDEIISERGRRLLAIEKVKQFRPFMQSYLDRMIRPRPPRTQ